MDALIADIFSKCIFCNESPCTCIQIQILLNAWRPRQDGCHFPDDLFKWIFFNECVWISIKISLKFVAKGPVNNIPALFQIMTWHRPGAKPLSESMIVSLVRHICVTRPQWVKITMLRSHYNMVQYNTNCLTHWPLCDLNEITNKSNFQSDFIDWWLNWSISCKIVLSDEKSLVWVMAWCSQATTHYLNPTLTQIYVTIRHH